MSSPEGLTRSAKASIVAGVVFNALDTVTTAVGLLGFDGRFVETNRFLAPLLARFGVVGGLLLWDSVSVLVVVGLSVLLTRLLNSVRGRPFPFGGFVLIFSAWAFIGLSGTLNNLVKMCAH
jgi:hypothetical protein